MEQLHDDLLVPEPARKRRRISNEQESPSSSPEAIVPCKDFEYDNTADNNEREAIYSCLMSIQWSSDPKYTFYGINVNGIPPTILKIIAFYATGEVIPCNICNRTETLILHSTKYNDQDFFEDVDSMTNYICKPIEVPICSVESCNQYIVCCHLEKNCTNWDCNYQYCYQCTTNQMCIVCKQFFCPCQRFVNYYTSGHLNPMELCRACNNSVCETCQDVCSNCDSIFCDDCGQKIEECDGCGDIFCRVCGDWYHCDGCRQWCPQKFCRCCKDEQLKNCCDTCNKFLLCEDCQDERNEANNKDSNKLICPNCDV